MDIFNITFIGFEGSKEVAKFKAQMSNEEFLHFTEGGVKQFIIDNHPEGSKLKLTNGLATIGKLAGKQGEQLELF